MIKYESKRKQLPKDNVESSLVAPKPHEKTGLSNILDNLWVFPLLGKEDMSSVLDMFVPVEVLNNTAEARDKVKELAKDGNWTGDEEGLVVFKRITVLVLSRAGPGWQLNE